MLRSSKEKSSKEQRLTAETLKQLLSYDAETGQFVWLVSLGSAKAGTMAGHVWTDTVKERSCKYWRIQIYGKKHQAHRLAWLYVKGCWPEHEIDHIDTDGLNNRWVNLREADDTQQACNRSIRSDNTSGLKGVSFHKASQKWQVKVTHKGCQKHIGLFETREAAFAAQRAAALESHGEFARVA
jgi:hypothetical protein